MSSVAYVGRVSSTSYNKLTIPGFSPINTRVASETIRSLHRGLMPEGKLFCINGIQCIVQQGRLSFEVDHALANCRRTNLVPVSLAEAFDCVGGSMRDFDEVIHYGFENQFGKVAPRLVWVLGGKRGVVHVYESSIAIVPVSTLDRNDLGLFNVGIFTAEDEVIFAYLWVWTRIGAAGPIAGRCFANTPSKDEARLSELKPKPDDKCLICSVEESCQSLASCGHRVVCAACKTKFPIARDDAICPVCIRQPID